MKHLKYILFIFLLTGIAGSTLFAQDENWEKIDEGEIEDASFVVEKNLEIELPQQNREFEKIPPLPSNPTSQINQNYNFLSIIPELSNLNIPNRALKLKSQPLEKFYGGNVTAGFGNYLTPYLDASLFNKRENKYALGINFNHISSRNGPVDKENSGSSETVAAIDTRYYGEKLTVGAKLNYDRQMVHYYGYPEGLEVDSDSIKQIYNDFNIGLWFGNTNKKDDFDYIIDANYNYIKDKTFSSSESKTEVNFLSNYFLKEGFRFHLDVNTMFSSYKNPESLSRNLIKVKPFVFYEAGDFDLIGGLNFTFQNDTISSRSSVLLFPFIDVVYHLNDYYSFFLKLDGDMEQVDFESIVNQNPFLGQGVELLHSNKKFGIDWGVRGNVNNYFNFLAGFKLSEYKDLYFFLNDFFNPATFQLEYEDENTSVMNIYGELVFSRIKNYNIGIRADYFNYSTKTLEEAWHRPTFELTGTFRYNLYEKIVFGSNIYFISGMKAKAYDGTFEETITLPSIFDLNLSVQYLFSDRLGAFLRFDNIIGRNYERYYRYPSRGIQIIGGVSINF
jgi:hypothetical protein